MTNTTNDTRVTLVMVTGRDEVFLSPGTEDVTAAALTQFLDGSTPVLDFDTQDGRRCLVHRSRVHSVIIG